MYKIASFVYFFMLASWPMLAALPPVVLPDDEAPHDYNLEWWYYTGHVESDDADAPRKFAFEMTVFRGEFFHIAGYVAHFALIDLDEKKHIPFQRINPVASQPFLKKGFKFTFDGGKWLVKGSNGVDTLRAKARKYGIDLKLIATKPASLFGDRGIIDYGAAGEMAYYSRTRMQTRGSVTVPDKKGRPKTYRVTGVTWMDHQWGNSGNPNQMSWDWFGIQLKNEIDLMVFRVRNRDTREVVKTAGFIVSESGVVSSIPEELITIQALNVVKHDLDVLYPTAWNIKVPAPYDIDFLTKARFAEQRFKVPVQVTPIYWEGSCSTEGIFRGEPVSGQGFTEMAGYE